MSDQNDPLTIPDCEILSWSAPKDWRFINLYLLADWHYGARNVPVKAMKKMVKLVTDDPFARWLGMGDLAENVTLGSKGDIFLQTPSPDAQIHTLGDLLRPIADKCVGFIGGNHGKRSLKAVGIDPDNYLAHLIGVSDKYRRICCDLKLWVNDTVYLVFAHHGRGGGATPGGRLNAMVKMADVLINADLYCMGHNHEATFQPSEARIFMHSNGHSLTRRTRIRRYFTAAGSLHPYEGTYAEEGLMKPAPYIQMKITLHSRVHSHKKGVVSNYDEKEKRITREEIFF